MRSDQRGRETSPEARPETPAAPAPIDARAFALASSTGAMMELWATRHAAAVGGVAAAPIPRRFHRPELDALRFLAFAFVLLDHLPVPPQSRLSIFRDVGSYGLSLFFVLSAYLIVSLLVREKTATGTVNVRAFMIRRVLRIWPLYFAAIILNAAIGLFYPPTRLTAHATISMFLLSTNLYILRNGWLLGMIAPLWSICIEEQFYLLVPWAARFSRRNTLVWFFGVVGMLSYGVLWRLGSQHAGYLSRIWPNSFVQFQFFAAGALFALLGRPPGLPLLIRGVLLVAGVALWFVAQFHYHLHSWNESYSGPSLCLGYACLLAGTSAVFFSFLGTHVQFPKLILHLGVISYGLYVFHQFWIEVCFYGLHLAGRHNFVASVAALGLTILTASLSYKHFELPILRLKRRFEVIATGPPVKLYPPAESR